MYKCFVCEKEVKDNEEFEWFGLDEIKFIKNVNQMLRRKLKLLIICQIKNLVIIWQVKRILKSKFTMWLRMEVDWYEDNKRNGNGIK